MLPQQGTRLLSNAAIKAVIAEGAEKVLKKSCMEAEDVIAALTAIADLDIAEIFDANWKIKDLGSIPPEVRKMIGSVHIGPDGTIKLKMADRMAAFRLLAQYHNLLVDRKEIKHSGRVEQWHHLDDLREYKAPPMEIGK